MDAVTAPDGQLVLVSLTDSDGVCDQVVTDFDFADAALAKDLRVQRADDWLEERVDAGGALHAFGLCLLDAIESQALVDAARDLFVDVRATLATRYRDVKATGRRRELTLADYLNHAGIPRPPHVGTGQTAQRLRYVRQQLARHGAYDDISGTAKSKWTKLLQQSAHDCRGLARLMADATESDAPMESPPCT